jgi:hypothetical protein
MKKNIIQKLLILILIIQCAIPKSVALAAVQDFPALNMELNIPDDTVILTTDTPIADDKWNLAGIIDPISEIKTMKQMGVQAILFDPTTKTKVSLLAKQSQQSKQIFHLSTLSEEELNNFLAKLIDLHDENATYEAEKYPQKETAFFRLYIETTQNNQHYKELVYGTIVNESIITFHIYQDKAETAINENYIKSLVDGVHFTKYYNIEEVKEQERKFAIFRVASFSVLLLSFAIWMLLLRKKKIKYNNLSKRKAEEISKFYLKRKEMGDTKSTILFLNRGEYSKNVFSTFFLYNEVISKTKQWIKLSVLYIIIFLFLKMADSSLFSYFLIVLLISMFIYIKKVTIEKLVNQEIKIFNISEHMEVEFQFYDDYLSMSGKKQAIIYPYLQITKVREYKNYIYLYFDINKAIYLNKDGFDLKTDDFITFIKQKTEQKHS